MPAPGAPVGDGPDDELPDDLADDLKEDEGLDGPENPDGPDARMTA
jgi:hypothetical protein